MDDLRSWLIEFMQASFARARAGLRFQPAVRVALDAGEAVVLGMIEEGFHRAKGEPMWWQSLIPILLDIVKRILDRRFPPGPVVMGAALPAAIGDADADRIATQLEAVVAKAPKQADAVGHDGGIVIHVQELIAALRARDWAKVWAVINDLIGHL